MNLTDLATEIERLEADAKRGISSEFELLDFLATHAAQIAAALRLLERAHDLAGDHISPPCVRWFEDYRALAGGEK